MPVVWSEGKFIEEEEFRVSPRDRGLCHGLSIFETVLAYLGRPKFIDHHLNRLAGGLVRLGVNPSNFCLDRIPPAMRKLLELNDELEGLARIRLTISLGRGPLNNINSGASWIWMTSSPVDRSEGHGLNLTIAPWKKNTSGVLNGLKLGSYAEHLVALDLARREGFDEMLFFNQRSELCEAAMANVFLVRGKRILTPGLDSGCLPGITRNIVLELAKSAGISTRVQALKKSDLRKANGIFLTSAIRGPVSVTQLGKRHFTPTKTFQKIQEGWLEKVSQTCSS